MRNIKESLTMAAITLLCVVGFSFATAHVATTVAAHYSTTADNVYAGLTSNQPTTRIVADGDAAKIIIHAPEMGEVGELIRLDVSESTGDDFKWIVVPTTLDFEVYQDGRKAVFSARKPGNYMFIIACSNAGTVDVITHTIKITGDNVPDPPTPDVYPVVPKPADGSPLAAWMPYWCSQSKQEKNEAMKLAASFNSVAATIAAGVNTTPDQIIKATANANRQALGGSIDRWMPVLQALQGDLQARANAGLLQTPEQHAAAWREIAGGLMDYSEMFKTVKTAPATVK